MAAVPRQIGVRSEQMRGDHINPRRATLRLRAGASLLAKQTLDTE
jgi:hypothetical protein